MMRPTICFVFLWLTLTPWAGAAERLRIVEEGGAKQSSREPVLVDLNGATSAQRAFIAALWTRYAADFPPEHRSFAVPDAGGIHIAIEHDGQTLDVFSCHTELESNPKLVVTVEGIMSLSGRTRAEILRDQPVWFQKFRAAFEAILNKARHFQAAAK